MVSKMYALCNHYSWFTNGTNSQYDKLFDMVRSGRSARELSIVIWLCSDDTHSEEEILNILLTEGYSVN